MRALANAADEQIRQTAEKILDGTHEIRQKRASLVSGGAESIDGARAKSADTADSGFVGYEQLTLESFITKITDDFTVGVKNLNLKESTANSKGKLRLYIDMLEELYRQI